jgi:hypothetical protein
MIISHDPTGGLTREKAYHALLDELFLPVSVYQNPNFTSAITPKYFTKKPQSTKFLTKKNITTQLNTKKTYRKM